MVYGALYTVLLAKIWDRNCFRIVINLFNRACSRLAYPCFHDLATKPSQKITKFVLALTLGRSRLYSLLKNDHVGLANKVTLEAAHTRAISITLATNGPVKLMKAHALLRNGRKGTLPWQTFEAILNCFATLPSE